MLDSRIFALHFLAALLGAEGSQYVTGSTAFVFATRTKSQKTITRKRLSDENIEYEDGSIAPDLIYQPSPVPIEEGTCSVEGDGSSCIDEKIESEQYEIAFETQYETKEDVIRDEKTMGKLRDLFSTAISMYTHFLAASALLTKCATAAFIGGIGDICAQGFQYRLSGSTRFSLDRMRLIGIAFECSVICAPLMHYAYDFLEKKVPIEDAKDVDEQFGQIEQAPSWKSWAAATFHVLVDTFLMGPIYVLSIMLTSSVFEGKLSTLRKDLVSNFGPTFKASLYASLGFMPMQVLAFRILPSQFRLLYMNLQDIIWNAVVSFMAHKSCH